MDREEQSLAALKARMTEKQRRDMSEIIHADLERREREKQTMAAQTAKKKSHVGNSTISGNLRPEQVKELYSDVNDAVKKIRLKQIEEQLSDLRKLKGKDKQGAAIMPRAPRSSSPNRIFGVFRAISFPRVVLAFLVVSVALLKILFSSGVVDASISKTDSLQDSKPELVIADAKPIEEKRSAAEAKQEKPIQNAPAWSDSEAKVLTELDARRVELEKRRETIDRREAEVEAQNRALAERLAELRSLTDRLNQARVEKDQRYEARLEQLSNVYGSMAPNEAAPLIAKLDTEIALSLLQRMPGKKMGQILSVMEQERAVELTKRLSTPDAPL